MVYEIRVGLYALPDFFTGVTLVKAQAERLRFFVFMLFEGKTSHPLEPMLSCCYLGRGVAKRRRGCARVLFNLHIVQRNSSSSAQAAGALPFVGCDKRKQKHALVQGVRKC